MVAKLVVDREKSVRLFGAAVQTHGGTVGERVGARFGVDGSGVTALLEALHGHLAARIADGVSAASEHERELADDAGLIRARDEALGALATSVIDAREAVSACWGPEGLAAHGVAGPTPRQSDLLVAFARDFGAALGNGKLDLPAPRPAVTVDRAALSERVTGGAAALDAAEKAVRVDRRENEATQDGKDAALEAYDVDFQDVVPVISSLLRSAGLHRTADRLIPSPRRPGQVEDPEASLPEELPEPV